MTWNAFQIVLFIFNNEGKEGTERKGMEQDWRKRKGK